MSDYTPTGKPFSVEEFENGLAAALEYFEKVYGSPSIIEQIKVWRTNSILEFHIQWAPQNPPITKPPYMMCHYHFQQGAHMDCHHHSRPGKNEPQN